MASLPDILNSQTSLLEDIGLSSIENFYELEKANTTLKNLEDIFTSLKKTLESSYALQERDSDYLKMFNEQEELRRLEAEREQQSAERIQAAPSEEKKSLLSGLNLSGFGLTLGKILRGGALAGMALLFAEEIQKIAESTFKTFFESLGFKNSFTNKLSEALGVGASGATIGAALGSIIGKPIQGAVIGAVIAMGPKITEAITAAGGNITTAEVSSYTIQGLSIGMLFGPKGAIIGAAVGFAVGLGKRILKEIEESKGVPGFFAKEVAGRSAAEGEMPLVEPVTPVLGAVSKRFESGKGGVATISSGKGDPGGKSYGEFQLASKTGTLQSFLESSEGKPFAEKYNLRTADIGTEEFDKNYRIAASEDTAKFAAAQKAFITRTHYEPVKNLAQQMGFNVNDRRVQEALFSQSVQHGLAGNKKILAAAAASAKGTPEEQVRAIYKARSEYVSGQAQIPEQTKEAILRRYEAEQSAVQQIVPVAASPTPTTTAVVGGTQATQIARDNMPTVVSAPVITSAPVSNITQIANNSRTTVVSAQSPRNTDPTFMRVQELNFA